MVDTITIADEDPTEARANRMAVLVVVAGALTPTLGRKLALECAKNAVQAADDGLLADAVSRCIAHRQAHPSLYPEWRLLPTHAVLEMIAAVKALDEARRTGTSDCPPGSR